MVDATALKWVVGKCPLRSGYRKKLSCVVFPGSNSGHYHAENAGLNPAPPAMGGSDLKFVPTRTIGPRWGPPTGGGWTSDMSSVFNLKGRIKRLWGS
jgi:hypothetical protein